MKYTSDATLIRASILLVAVCFAKEVPGADQLKENLAAVSAAELPARAAELVLQAKIRERAATTKAAVREAIQLNPAAASVIVGSIARTAPAMASVAASAGAIEQPKQAAAIARAAAAAAPSMARKIVLAVCRAVPSEYRAVAVAVSQAVPGSSKEILQAVAIAFPGFKPYVDQALAAYGGYAASVGDILDQAARQAQSSASGKPSSGTNTRTAGATWVVSGPSAPIPKARGPTIGPPYIPLTTTPTNVTPGTSGEVPPGGRNYAAP